MTNLTNKPYLSTHIKKSWLSHLQNSLLVYPVKETDDLFSANFTLVERDHRWWGPYLKYFLLLILFFSSIVCFFSANIIAFHGNSTRQSSPVNSNFTTILWISTIFAVFMLVSFACLAWCTILQARHQLPLEALYIITIMVLNRKFVILALTLTPHIAIKLAIVIVSTTIWLSYHHKKVLRGRLQTNEAFEWNSVAWKCQRRHFHLQTKWFIDTCSWVVRIHICQ